MSSKRKNQYVLILREVPLHPNSYLTRIENAFEKPSIVHIHGKEGLRKYTQAPTYDEQYLILFEEYRVFESNINTLRLDIMFPVLVCTSKAQVDNAVHLCQDKSVPFRIYHNEFKKADGIDLIHSLTKEEVSASFCDALISRVGLSPKRIISAMMVCEQVGYTVSNISKYVDKYNYIDIYDVIESLLGICKSQAQIRRAAMYIHQSRLWYRKYTKASLLREVGVLLSLYQNITDGVLTEYTIDAYIEQERVSRYRVLYGIELYERVSYTSLLALQQFLEKASLLDVVTHLS